MADVTRRSYLREQVKLVMHLHEIQEDIINPMFFAQEGAMVDDDTPDKSFLKTSIAAATAESICPLNLGEAKASVIVGEYMVAKNEDREKMLGKSTFLLIGSAVKDLYRMYEVPVPDLYDAEMKKASKGYAKMVTKARKTNEIGKKPLPFDLLVYLNRAMLQSGSTEHIFGHLFAVMSWNLMCRSNNTENCDLSHLQ